MQFSLNRVPPTIDKSLRAWSAADEYLHKVIQEKRGTLLCLNDRFGYLNVALHHFKPYTLILLHSQKKSIENNLSLNGLSITRDQLLMPFDQNDCEYDLVSLLMPKSIELMNWYLHYAANHLPKDGQLICGFMTKHFTPTLLEEAQQYFGVVEQSLAYKKARVLVCKEPIKGRVGNFLKNIHFNGIDFQQYAGVFSSSHIDYATQYLINTYKFRKQYTKILDFGCGNGVIAQHISSQNPNATIFCVDDSIFAIESTKINLPNAKTIWTHDLSEMEESNFDLIVSNPPFHFEYETDISVSLKFFEDARNKFHEKGYLVIVSNKHLNYSTHLKRLFGQVVVIDQNDKFEILEAH